MRWRTPHGHRPAAESHLRDAALCLSPARLRAMHSRDAALAPLRLDCGLCTFATPRWPPSGSKTGSALSPTPPQGGSDTWPANSSLLDRAAGWLPAGNVALTLRDLQPGIRMRAGRPRSRVGLRPSITPPLKGSRRSFCGGGFAQAAPNGAVLCAVAGSHRPSYRRRPMRWRDPHGHRPTAESHLRDAALCPPPARLRAMHSRDAALAPLRLEDGLRPLADSPSRGE